MVTNYTQSLNTYNSAGTARQRVKAILAISPGGVDYALDAVGAPATARQILQAVRQGGLERTTRAAWRYSSGFPPVSEVSFDLNEILLYQRQYRGSLGATKPDTDFPLFLEWVHEGKFPLEKL